VRREMSRKIARATRGVEGVEGRERETLKIEVVAKMQMGRGEGRNYQIFESEGKVEFIQMPEQSNLIQRQ